MFKASIVTAFLAVMAFSPAYAAQDLCNDAHMKKMHDMIAKMTDASRAGIASNYAPMAE